MRQSLGAVLASSIRKVPPPAGPTRVALTVRASGPTLGAIGYSYSMPGLASVKAGDLIVVLRQMANGSSATVTDNSGTTNTWVTDYDNTLSGNNSEYVYHAIAQADTASLVVSLSAGTNSFGIIVAAAYRAPAGKTWAYDSANMSVTEGTFDASTLSKTFNTSGPGVVLVGLNSANFDNSATYGANGTCVGATVEGESPPNATAAVGYFGYMADYLAEAALSSHVVTGGIYTTSPGDTAARKDLIIAPFAYS